LLQVCSHLSICLRILYYQYVLTIIAENGSKLPLSERLSGFFGNLSSPDSFPEMGRALER